MSVTKMAILCFALGWMYNEILDFSSWVWLYNMNVANFVAVFGMGLPFGILHAGGNVVFTVALGKAGDARVPPVPVPVPGDLCGQGTGRCFRKRSSVRSAGACPSARPCHWSV